MALQWLGLNRPHGKTGLSMKDVFLLGTGLGFFTCKSGKDRISSSQSCRKFQSAFEASSESF